MKSRIIKGICSALSMIMVIATLSGCDTAQLVTSTSRESNTGTSSAKAQADTLVVGCDEFSGNFSPFYASAAGDETVLKLTSQSLMGYDRNGEVIKLGLDGQVGSYEGVFYKYYGITDCIVTRNDDGTVDYAFTLRDGVEYPDGTLLTVDDIIFTMYVLSDPIYDGPSDFSSLPIQGMKQYRSDMDTLFNLLVDAGRDNNDFAFWDEKTQEQFWADLDSAGEKFVKSICDRLKAAGYNSSKDSVAACMENWGFDVSANATELDVFHDLIDYYNGDILGMSAVENVGTSLVDFMDNYEEYSKVVNVDAKIDTITGIKKIDYKHFTVTMTEFDTKSIYGLNIYVAPLKYYGDKMLYNYDKNMFGFEKGNLTSIKEKTDPFGAGPYKFTAYEDEGIMLEANSYYWKGTPQIAKVRLVNAENGSKLNSLVIKSFDITNIELTGTILGMIKEINANKEISGDKITTILYDKPGYGYIGISAANVKVGSDKSSEQSKALRKAFATLFSFYKEEAVRNYYGEMASVIEYPVSYTFWGAPQKSTEGYKRAFITDVKGEPVYTLDMNKSEREQAVIEAAIGFFREAGFTYDDAKGTFTDSPDGAKLSYEAIITAGGTGDHPTYEVLSKAKATLAEMGITLVIKDIKEGDYLWEALDMDTAEIWAAAWGSSVEPNLYQNYHSDNYFSGRFSNYYGIEDDDLDKYIIETQTVTDEASRVSSYKKAFDIILDWGIEVPIYERKNAYLYSTSKLDEESLPKDMTVYWDWTSEIETLKLKQLSGPESIMPQ